MRNSMKSFGYVRKKVYVCARKFGKVWWQYTKVNYFEYYENRKRHHQHLQGVERSSRQKANTAERRTADW